MRAFPSRFCSATYSRSNKLHKSRRRLSLAGTITPIEGFGHSRGVLSDAPLRALKEAAMNSIIYLVGLLVVVMAILSLLGLR